MAARPTFPLDRRVLAQVQNDDKKAVNNACSVGRYLSLPVAPCGLCNKEKRALQFFLSGLTRMAIRVSLVEFDTKSILSFPVDHL